jgi:septum formation protein
MAGLWLSAEPLILASTSATRRDLLEWVGLPVRVIAPGVDEREAEALLPSGTTPLELARHLAAAKATVVSASHPGRIVIGADQTLDLDGIALSKPASRAEAAEHLARLSGRSHRLHAAAAIARDGMIVDLVSGSARLTMRALDPAAIEAYVARAGDDVLGSVGGYRIEAVGLHLFEAIEGEHTTVLGLPMLPLLAALRRLNLLAW